MGICTNSRWDSLPLAINDMVVECKSDTATSAGLCW